MAKRGAGEGTVYQRKSDGRWVAELTLEDGKRKFFYAKTQEEAIKKLHQAQYEMKQGVLATGPKQKLADHLTWWLDEVHRQRIRESSYVRYRYALDKHILPALGDIQLQKLTTQKIQAFYNSKLKAGQSSSSVHTMHKVLHKALDYAVHIRLISYNPSDHVSLPQQAKRKVKPFNLEQARHLLQVAKGGSLEAFLILALATGARHGELVALRWEDVDLEKGSIYIHRTAMYYGKGKVLEGDPKTETSERTIPISKTVCGVLMAHRAHQNEIRLKVGPAWENLDLVFCNRMGGFLKHGNTNLKFQRLLKKAGFPPMHIHDLRHVASTLFQDMGVNLKVVQEILGHKEMSQTWDYTYVIPSQQIEAAEKMDRLFQ